MSAAIAHKNSANTTATNTTAHMYFECGDIFTTNKSRTPNGHTINVLTINNNNNNKNNTNSLLNSYDNVMDISSSNHSSIEHMDKINHIPLQQQQQQKQQSLIIGQEKNQQHIAVYRGHAALTRTISTPQPQYKQGQQQQQEQYVNGQGEQQQQSIQQSQQQQQTAQDGNVAILVNTLIENLGNLNLHRKLERTQSEPLPQPVNTSRYKTELCRPFEEAGECKYGEKCQFAHGYHELRNLQRHPKYKTEFCRTFHSVGFCPYGPRCHFVHNADEARALQQQQQQQQQQQFQQQQQTKLQNHSNGFLVVAPATFHHVSTKSTKNNTQLAVGGGGGGGATINNNHALPLSPPLSMSTGSDRESPTGSLSLSPTSSMTNFSFGEQVNNTNNTVFQAAFQYMNTPPDSPGVAMSPVNTPPPPPPPTTLILNGQQPIYIKANNMNNNNNNNIKVINQQQLAVVPPPVKQLLQKSSSSPIAILRHNVVNKVATPNKVQSVSSLNIMNLAVPTMDEQRLPVFNRLSLAVDNNIINNNNNNNSNDTANNTNIISSYTQVAL